MEQTKLDPREQHFRIQGPIAGLRLFLRALPAATPRRTGIVLYVHGATFPSALSIAHRFDGRPWRDELCAAGFDTWGLDFHGYGASDPYPEMVQPAEINAPLGRIAIASAQIAAAARFVLDHSGPAKLSIIAHSWGTMPAAHCAGAHPELIDRLVLFGPVARRDGAASDAALPAWRTVTLHDQWTRFIEDVPAGETPVLLRRHFDDWGERYLGSDPGSRDRDPPAVRVPAGPVADIHDAWSGRFPYDPGLVRAPVAIVRGAWDSVIPDADARWLFENLTSAPLKRDIKIARGTHLMHLETMRYALYRESIGFLQGGDTPPE